MNLFIIGCGFTKSIFPQAPLNNDLLSALSTSESEKVVKTISTKYQTNDIEIALTKLDADISTSFYDNKKLHNELKKFRYNIEIALGNYFFSYRATNELFQEKPWLKDFLHNAFVDGDVAINLNYDCSFEGVLDCIGKWTPLGGYGYLANPLIDESAYQKSPITVLKIHGSTTFRIAAYADKPDCKAVGFVFDEIFFPVSGKNIHFGYGLGEGQTYLIAPSYVKTPTVEMTYLMIDALKAASESQTLIVVGCGLRPEDSFLTLLLTHFLRQPQWEDRKIIIVDINANAIAQRIKNYWGVNIERCINPIEIQIEDSLKEFKKVIHL